MKKIISVLLVLIMIFSSVSYAFAADPDDVPERPYTDNILTVYASDAVLDGETKTATVSVNVKNNPGIWGLDMVVVYPDCLTAGSKDAVTLGEAPVPSEYSDIGSVDNNAVGNGIMKYIISEIGKENFESTYGVIGGGLLWHLISRSGIENPDYTYPDCDNTGIIEEITFTYDVTKNKNYGDFVPVYLIAFSKSAFHSEPIHADKYYEWLEENDGCVLVECFNGSVDVSAVCRHENTRYQNVVLTTCTRNGSFDVYCADCNAFVKTVVEKAPGHIYSEEWTVDIEPTLTENGSESRHCTKCGAKTDIRSIPKFCTHELTQRANVIYPTCISKGSYDVKCAVCGDYLEYGLVLDYAGHQLSNEWVILTDPTYDDEGLKAMQCYTCKEYFEYTVIPKLCRHENTDRTNITEPTCTEDGVCDIICLDCNEIIEKGVAIEKTGHTFSEEWTIDIEATETTEGEESRHCLYCEERCDIKVIPKIPTYKKGDIDGNGRVNSRDLYALKMYVGNKPIDIPIIKQQLDVDGNRRVNSMDVLALKMMLK